MRIQNASHTCNMWGLTLSSRKHFYDCIISQRPEVLDHERREALDHEIRLTPPLFIEVPYKVISHPHIDCTFELFRQCVRFCASFYLNNYWSMSIFRRRFKFALVTTVLTPSHVLIQTYSDSDFKHWNWFISSEMWFTITDSVILVMNSKICLQQHFNHV